MSISMALIWIVFILSVALSYSSAQLSVIFGNPTQAENCRDWGSWGPCIWIKSGLSKRRGLRVGHRWDRNYFDQLRPGKSGCQNHIFYRIVRKRWGTAFDNVFQYLRDTTIESKPCGMCSYQQSCGRVCHRKNIPGKSTNFLFVAEQLCRPDQLRGHRQDISCSTNSVINNCNLWPSPNVKLPNVSQTMKAVIEHAGFVNCIKQKKSKSKNVCRCCCNPYEPDPKTFKCRLKTGLDVGENLKID